MAELPKAQWGDSMEGQYLGSFIYKVNEEVDMAELSVCMSQRQG